MMMRDSIVEGKMEVYEVYLVALGGGILGLHIR